MGSSENVIFEAQFTDFFILWKSHILFLRYSVFHILNHCITRESCDVMMSISTWGRTRFWILDALRDLVPSVMLCAIWYHLYYLKNVKNTHRGVLLVVKLQANDTKLRNASQVYLNRKSFGYKTWPTNIVMGNILRTNFTWFWGLDLEFVVFYFFESTHWDNKK